MKYFKKLLGDRIYLSPLAADEEEIELFAKWLNDFETSDYIGRSNAITTFEAEKEFLTKKALNNKDIQLAIVTIDENKFIGTVSLENIDYINRTAILGIFIGDEENRNKGYGTEAIRLILDFGFNYINLNNIKLDLMEFNQRAYKCYQKCGFKEYGRRRKCRFINGKYYDKIEMDVLAEEFTNTYIRNKNIK